MTKYPRHFSQFSVEEQHIAVALVGRYAAYLNRKQQLEKITQAAGSCLAARPHVEALHKRPALAAFAEQLAAEQEAFFQEQQAIIRTAQDELSGTLAVEENEIAPQKAKYHEAMEAVRQFLKTHGASHLPVVYDDVTWGDGLINGFEQFVKIVTQELSETRTCLTEHKPDMLRYYPFVSAAAFIEEEGCGAGLTVYEAADILREVRARLARLRAEAVKPTE